MAGYGLFSAGQQNAKALLTGRYVHIFEGVIFQSDMRRKFSNRLRVFKFGHFSFTPIPTCASGSSLVRESQIPRIILTDMPIHRQSHHPRCQRSAGH
jgi:hypothetical protein